MEPYSVWSNLHSIFIFHFFKHSSSYKILFFYSCVSGLISIYIWADSKDCIWAWIASVYINYMVSYINYQIISGSTIICIKFNVIFKTIIYFSSKLFTIRNIFWGTPALIWSTNEISFDLMCPFFSFLLSPNYWIIPEEKNLLFVFFLIGP